MRRKIAIAGTSLALIGALAFAVPALFSAHGAQASSTATYDINTLAGKVASVNGTAGLQIRMSAFIQEEADSADTYVPGTSSGPITPTYIQSSPLDGTSIAAPAVTVNQDNAAAPQNETAIAVDPNNPDRVVGAANDYVTRTWTCTINGTPCSALGDGYSGTYYSNDGGKTWCCSSKLDGSSIGTIIPGVTHLAGGQYDAGGDPALAFDSSGNVYYAGLGFDRTSAPNTVTLSKGTFDSSGKLTWGQPTFINPTTSPAVFNDKEWVAADASPSSPYRDHVYVTWTRFVFDPANGSYVQSPISFVSSSDGGKTFTTPQLISGNVLYGQGSRPVVGPDGTIYVFWDGATRLATYDSTYMVKSSDGGATWSAPVQVSPLGEIVPPANTVFRVNSFPAAAVAPDGHTLYAAWSTQVKDSTTNYGDPAQFCGDTSGCHSAAVYSKSTDGGATWSAPQPIFGTLNASSQKPVGYPVTQPSGGKLSAPATPHRVDTLWPGVAISPSGRVYMSAYGADVISPWQTCAEPATPTAVGRIDCLQLGDYVDNARLDYYVADLSTGVSNKVSTHPINTRYDFGGGFIGDYTDLTVGSDNVFHALWTDTNNVQDVNWFYGYQFAAGTKQNQQDVATASGKF